MNLRAQLHKPPNPLPPTFHKPVVFLAGSIAMGLAEPWQERAWTRLATHDLHVLNPRRDAWKSEWGTSDADPIFRAQVEWELNGLRRADWVLMYFAPDTQAPITLLELGLTAASGKVRVACPKTFWRSGNVAVVCRHFDLPLFPDLDSLLTSFEEELNRAGTHP